MTVDFVVVAVANVDTKIVGRYGAVLVALAISYDGNRSIRRPPYDGNCSPCDTV